MRDIDELFTALAKSAFRSRFKLRPRELAVIEKHGLETIRLHAHDLITKRLAPAAPQNDGRQTPMRNHPVFVAQHAVGACCRSCLEKWHHIPQGSPLTPEQIRYIVDVIMVWIVGATRESPSWA